MKLNHLARMQTAGKTSKNPHGSPKHFQKQKGTDSTRQKIQLKSGKEESQSQSRENLKKQAKTGDKSCSDRQNDSKDSLKEKKENKVKVHEEVYVVEKKCSEDIANQHLINKNKTESGQTTEKEQSASQSSNQEKRQGSKGQKDSIFSQKKENDNYEDARMTNSEECGQSAQDNKQEIKCKRWKAERDALITENEKKGLESQKIEQQEEMKKDKKEKEYLC